MIDSVYFSLPKFRLCDDEDGDVRVRVLPEREEIVTWRGPSWWASSCPFPAALCMIFHGNPVRTAEELEVVQNISREELFRSPAEESSDS